nr:hypothetical protein [Streptomyces sp. SID12501]
MPSFVAPGPRGVAVRTRLKDLAPDDEKVLRVVSAHLGSLASKDLAARGRDSREPSGDAWAARKRELTPVSSSRWAGSITKATHDQWALARRGQLAHIQCLEAGIRTLTHRLSQPLGQKGSKGVPGGYRSRREWHAKSRRLHTLEDRLAAARADREAAIVGIMSSLFNDYEPRDEDGRRVVFEFGASVLRSGTGIAEIDETLREKYLSFDDRPRAEWHVEVDFDAIAALARILVDSRERPDTQIVQPVGLELLVRDETQHATLLAPEGAATVYEMPTPRGTCTVTVGPPSVPLLLRLELRRTGMERLAVFDRQRTLAHLMEQERREGLAEGAVARISAQQLLDVTAEPRLRSLRLDGPPGLDLAELEQVATAFRVRLAYESDVVLVPVLDVNRLDGSSQPRLIRQLPLRAEEFVEAIGQGTATGFMGDRLLGPVPEVQEGHEVQEELSQRYLRAIAATDPFAAFMGYYQVLEYSMEEEWFQALRRRVEAAGGALERPADSIRKAAKLAADVLSERKNDLSFSEIRGLKAVLDKHLDVGALATDLDRYLRGAADHFATATVPFVQVPHLDFGRAGDPAGQATLRERAAERIYKVRCAITHSKESGDRYSPYTDELPLGREVPLVRIAAEHLLFPADERL